MIFWLFEHMTCYISLYWTLTKAFCFLVHKPVLKLTIFVQSSFSLFFKFSESFMTPAIIQSFTRGKRPHKVILPSHLTFLLCLMETSVLGTAPTLLQGFASEGKVFILVDLRLRPNIHAGEKIISHHRAEWTEEGAGSLSPSLCIISLWQSGKRTGKSRRWKAEVPTITPQTRSPKTSYWSTKSGVQFNLPNKKEKLNDTSRTVWQLSVNS